MAWLFVLSLYGVVIKTEGPFLSKADCEAQRAVMVEKETRADVSHCFPQW